MTPKEKAEELVDKFYDTTPNEAFINEPLVLSTPYSSWGQAKQCALIAVDELINTASPVYDSFWPVNTTEFWTQVKEEIEKL